MAVKIKVKKDPNKEEVKETAIYSPGSTPADDTADVRDILTATVGKGYTNLADDNIRANFTRLQALVGPEQARKLMTHAFIYNQNPAMQKLPVEARIKTFYDTPAGDETVQSTLKRVKGFGYGVLPGFRESSNQINQELAGRVPTETAMVSPEMQKIKLRVAAKTQ